MSRRDHHRITSTLRAQYREAAETAERRRCRELAEKMTGLERDNRASAEAVYALAFALEMLGQRDKARTQYQTALVIDRTHLKARRRLARLGISSWR